MYIERFEGCGDMECLWCHIPMIRTDIRNIGRRIEIEPKTFVCKQCNRIVSIDKEGKCSWTDEFGNMLQPSHDK